MADAIDNAGIPTVEPNATPPDDYQHIQTSPEEFGGAIAQGAEKLGTGAIAASKFYGSVAADHGTNQLQEYNLGLLNGVPGQMATGPDGAPLIGPDGKPLPDTGYLGKRGADAMSAAPEVSAQLDKKIAEIRASLPTLESQQQFDQDSRRYRFNWANQIADHARTQQDVWAQDTNRAAESNGLNVASANPNDMASVAEATNTVLKARIRDAQHQMGDSLTNDVMSNLRLSTYQDIAVARIRSLSPTDPLGAQKVLDENKPALSSLPGYSELARGVKEAVANSQMGPGINAEIQTAKANAQSMVGNVAVPQQTSINDALLQQESGNNPAVKPSIDGAIGPGQIMPGTFAQFAHPGEKIDNPTDNRTVANRAIESYKTQFNNDPQRVAVAYFSGPGNVAPIGSPTPWIRDTQDGNGKTVSSYVADVAAKSGASAQKYPSVADALRGNEDAILSTAQDHALKMFPDYPDKQEQYVTGVRRNLDQAISQQEQQTVIDTHIVQQALASDHPPISEQQLLATSPQVAQAWRNMQMNNPYAAVHVENMFDANARGKAVTYGTEVAPFIQRVLAPPGDPDRITNASQLWGNIDATAGEHSPLTNTGAQVLNGLIQMRNTPQGEANATQLRAFLKNYHDQQTFGNENSNLQNPKGEERFNKSMLSILPAITTGLANGKTVAEMTDPKSKDYVGNLGVPLPSLTEKMNEIISAKESALAAPPAKAVLDPAKVSSVDEAIKAKQFSPEQGAQLKGLMLAVQERHMTPEQAKQKAQEMGIFPPDVPKPGP